MFESIGRSFDIVKRSFGLLMEEKKLIIFPLISAIVLIAVLISFILPKVLVSNSNNSDALNYLLVITFYFIAYFIIIFFNTALVHAVDLKLNNKEVSIQESLSFAASRIVNIISWALIAATVGLILNLIYRIASRQKVIGPLIASLVIGAIGFVWSMATYFVVPIMAFEDVGPLEAIKRSVSLIKKTWGEEVVGGFGIGIVFLILYVIGFLLGLGAVMLTAGSGALLITALGVVALYFIIVYLVQSTVQSIFVVELYKFASSGQATLFNSEDLQGAFKPKTPPQNQNKLF